MVRPRRLRVRIQGRSRSADIRKRQVDDINGIARWPKRAVEVARQGKDNAKLRQEIKEHRGRMQQLFNMVVAPQKAGVKCELDKLEAEYLLLEAEGWDLNAKLAAP